MATASADGAPLTAARALRWWLQALVFLRRAPLRLSLVPLLPLAVEIVLQVLPAIGIVLSKLVTPLAVALVFLAYDNFMRRGTINLSVAGARLRALGAGRLAGLALVSMLIYGVQVIAAYLAQGSAGLEVTVLGRVEPQPPWLDQRFFLLIIMAGLIPSTLLLFFGPLVVLGRQAPMAAALRSATTLLQAPGALLVTLAISALLVTLGLLWGYGIGLLLVMIWGAATTFVAYRDVFGTPAADAAPPAPAVAVASAP